MSIPDYMVDIRTHKRWWTCIPAWPLSKEDRYYTILKHVFSDHTTNTKSKIAQWQEILHRGGGASPESLACFTILACFRQ